MAGSSRPCVSALSARRRAEAAVAQRLIEWRQSVDLSGSSASQPDESFRLHVCERRKGGGTAVEREDLITLFRVASSSLPTVSSSRRSCRCCKRIGTERSARRVTGSGPAAQRSGGERGAGVHCVGTLRRGGSRHRKVFRPSESRHSDGACGQTGRRQATESAQPAAPETKNFQKPVGALFGLGYEEGHTIKVYSMPPVIARARSALGTEYNLRVGRALARPPARG
jgi:hypothetical protein